MALSFQNREQALMTGETNPEETQETAVPSQDAWVTTVLEAQGHSCPPTPPPQDVLEGIHLALESPAPLTGCQDVHSPFPGNIGWPHKPVMRQGDSFVIICLQRLSSPAQWLRLDAIRWFIIVVPWV